MSSSDHKSQSGGDHYRRESELSAPVSDYEYFQQFTPSHVRPPPTPQTPQTPNAPPLYTGGHSPISPPLGNHSSQGETVPLSPGGIEHHASYPEVVPPGHQYSPRVPEYQMTPDHGEKEAYAAAPEAYSQPTVQPAPVTKYRDAREDPIPIEERKRKKRPFGLSKRNFIIAIVAIVIIIIAIAVGVGVGVGVGTGKHHSSNSTSKDPNYSIGGAYNPAYFSTQGAFNGSGVALADVNFGLDNSLYIFYQRYTGEIEQVIYESDGSWNFVTQVASNAKNGTPLSTVAYIVDSVATWHLFYISEDNLLKQRVQTNSSQFQTNIWEDGPLNALNLQAYDGDSVGMQACYWGNYYGSLTNYNDAAFLASNSTPNIGMNIWFADTATSFQQYDWTNGQSQWNHTRTWNDMNGHCGVGCQSWLSNTTSYVFMVDTSNTLGIWWKDIDTNLTSTDSHPINSYQKAANINIPGVHPSTSLGYTDFMIYQTPDGSIHGVNVTWAAENTSIAPARQSTIGAAESNSSSYDEWALQPGDVGIPGTHMAITGSTPLSGGRQELLFYQELGNDLRLGKRDSDGGDFTFLNVPLANLRP